MAGFDDKRLDVSLFIGPLGSTDDPPYPFLPHPKSAESLENGGMSLPGLHAAGLYDNDGVVRRLQLSAKG
jgi:hypothetical protein